MTSAKTAAGFDASNVRSTADFRRELIVSCWQQLTVSGSNSSGAGQTQKAEDTVPTKVKSTVTLPGHYEAQLCGSLGRAEGCIICQWIYASYIWRWFILELYSIIIEELEKKTIINKKSVTLELVLWTLKFLWMCFIRAKCAQSREGKIPANSQRTNRAAPLNVDLEWFPVMRIFHGWQQVHFLDFCLVKGGKSFETGDSKTLAIDKI